MVKQNKTSARTVLSGKEGQFRKISLHSKELMQNMVRLIVLNIVYTSPPEDAEFKVIAV